MVLADYNPSEGDTASQDGDTAAQDGDTVMGETAEQDLTSKIHKNKVAITAEEEESWRVYPELVRVLHRDKVSDL